MDAVTANGPLLRELHRRVAGAGLHAGPRRDRYEEGERLRVAFTAVWPEEPGTAVLRIGKFVGGGFAGQVYRCILEEVSGPGAAVAGLTPGATCAVKILIPASRFARRFRDALYWLGFQSAFSHQVNGDACRCALLWQKLARRAAALRLGREDAVAEVNAWFFDAELGAYGEIREWVEGRVWRLEPDTNPRARRRWRTLDLQATASREYVAKRRFMADFVRLLHDMGAPELARQYEWWTLKSQPNVLKRFGHDSDPGGGLCAVDFRAGLALLPFLPMSPGDVVLIARGLRRGALVQFDRGDCERLRRFVAEAGPGLADAVPMVEALAAAETAYRRSMPDLSRQGLRLLWDRGLRRDVRAGLAAGYVAAGLADSQFAGRLRQGGPRFEAFYLLGAVPLLGRFARRAWGCAAFRRHLAALASDRGYFRRWAAAGIAASLVRWLHDGRVGPATADRLKDSPPSFWVQRLTVGLLPPRAHRAAVEPRRVWEKVRDGWRFARSFFRDASFREKWLTDQVLAAWRDGSLDASEKDAILARVRDPYIVTYLKALGVHFATLPVSEIVFVLAASVAAGSVLVSRGLGEAALEDAGKLFGAVILGAQMVPISPGSICRGFYVFYLMWRDRNVRDYLIAAPVSFVKGIGYIAFPLQMATSYPALSRFMASRWATEAVHIVPVFGEKGAWLEHAVFDLCYNRPRIAAGWVRGRMRGLLDLWMFAGLAVLAIHLWRVPEAWHSRSGIQAIVAVLVLCVMPRTVFYPVMRRRV